MDIFIRGNCVSLEELQDDVVAARAKGLSDKFAFTPETVQALIDKLIGMEIILKDSIDYLDAAEKCEGVTYGYQEIANRYSNFK